MPGARRFFVSLQGLGKDLVFSSVKNNVSAAAEQKSAGGNSGRPSIKKCGGQDSCRGGIVFGGGEHNHLANVLRLGVNDEIIVVCGDEFDYYYKIIRITKSETFLRFERKSFNVYNPKTRFTVFLGVIKHDNLMLAVEKLNEIGVSEVVLFKSANCQNSPVKHDKLVIAAQQSCKQCGRSIPIGIRGVLGFSEMIKMLPQNTVFADEKEEPSGIKSMSASAVIIGPEGGFADFERKVLREVARPISLGNRILRAETAAIASSAILLNMSVISDGELPEVGEACK